ncbi:gluconate 2-dehydrogenase subunit 3 family protein [Hyunsoonleella flava]|uniref:Gluconate 2-dehydrogenase subunit 3 family protein n=1 Tax=Hyunsoonleella flava TaxID=2527939 RepID=A0A4Q9FBP0_9FLAO|nr:gluconate 2-dehydrogenase subunit 3 family protein [Hyunsoonleella flava]TBN02620.1 gluconate 2-dehydrogenase subunit 3 family protein [Hyunsoonleella flava]
MKRREALKQIGLTLGYSALAPSALSILQSCTSEAKKWTPVFFTEEEAIIIKNLVDLILPKTDKSPGALDVNVPQFIDLYASKAYDDKTVVKYREEIKSIVDALPISEDGAKGLKPEDYTTLLDKYLKISKTEANQLRKERNLVFKALSNLRNQTVWAYKTSEIVGEKVLAYDPIPAQQIGCLPLDEATEGKAWSL